MHIKDGDVGSALETTIKIIETRTCVRFKNLKAITSPVTLPFINFSRYGERLAMWRNQFKISFLSHTL